MILVSTVFVTTVVLFGVGFYYVVCIGVCLLVDGVSLFTYVLLDLIMSVSSVVRSIRSYS
jgi:hypothetical protein